MTAYDVDLDELATVIVAMASCERDLRDLAADVAAALATLHAGWEGLAREPTRPRTPRGVRRSARCPRR